MKKTKIIALLALVPVIAFSHLYVNADENKMTSSTSNENTKLAFDDLSFTNFKEIVINSLKKESKYAISEKLKTQIESSIKIVEKINEEKIFTETLEKEYAKIDVIFEKDLQEWKRAFSEDKKEILDDLSEELKNSVTDSSIMKKVNQDISVLEKITKQEDFFEKLNQTYDFLDTYYEKNNIIFFDEEDVFKIDIDDIK